MFIRKTQNISVFRLGSHPPRSVTSALHKGEIVHALQGTSIAILAQPKKLSKTRNNCRPDEATLDFVCWCSVSGLLCCSFDEKYNDQKYGLFVVLEYIMRKLRLNSQPYVNYWKIYGTMRWQNIGSNVTTPVLFGLLRWKIWNLDNLNWNRTYNRQQQGKDQQRNGK